MITLFCIQPKGFNVGNEAIHVGLRQLLQDTFGQVVNIIALPATARYETHATAGLTARTIHEINQYGHGVIVGGGNLYENGELDVDLDALSALEPPLLLFSLSRGRIYNRRRELVTRTDAMPDRVIRALNDKARHSLVRDDATLMYLHAIGCSNAQLGGCPTVFLDRITERLPAVPRGDRSGVLISVRHPNLMNVPLSDQAQVRHTLEELIAFLRSETLGPVRVLCHDHRDIPFAATLDDVDYVYTGDVYSYLSLLRTCRLSVSYRLHATLPCMAFGTANINISYDERASSTMATHGLGEWDIDMFDGGSLFDAVIDRYRRLDELPGLVAQARERWHTLYATVDHAFERFLADIVAYNQAIDAVVPQVHLNG